MTSGKTLQDDKDIGMRMGASVYLTKPVSPSVMLSNVKSLLGEE
jgi:DNA-binding response OmpR family regulator